MMNPNWPRWIVASICKHVDDNRQSLPMFLEGNNHTEDQSDYIELRIDGPYTIELSHNYFRLNVEVNVLVVSSINDSDLHKIYKDCGIVLAALSKVIPVYRYGDGPDDDQTRLCCLTLVSSGDQREALRVSHFGQMDATKPIMRSSVEGHYNLYLHGSN